MIFVSTLPSSHGDIYNFHRYGCSFLHAGTDISLCIQDRKTQNDILLRNYTNNIIEMVILM
jgi:hypothetical protein